MKKEFYRCCLEKGFGGNVRKFTQVWSEKVSRLILETSSPTRRGAPLERLSAVMI